MGIKAVIFDLDGVLLDSQPLHFEVDIALLREFGVDAGHNIVDKHAGMTTHNRLSKYKRDFNLPQSFEEIWDANLRILNEKLDKEPLPKTDGIVELLEKIKGAGYKTAVASSSSDSYVRKVLGQADLLRFFDILVNSDNVENGKPAPDIFNKALRLLGVPPDSAVIFEDSRNGVLAAAAAGVKCIGYLNPTSGEQDLSAASAVIGTFYDYEKIEKFIRGII
ncbi:phosphatase [Clostridia bacterium]|nr:phosphatase [Clostridia bacterium]